MDGAAKRAVERPGAAPPLVFCCERIDKVISITLRGHGKNSLTSCCDECA